MYEPGEITATDLAQFAHRAAEMYGGITPSGGAASTRRVRRVRNWIAYAGQVGIEVPDVSRKVYEAESMMITVADVLVISVPFTQISKRARRAISNGSMVLVSVDASRDPITAVAALDGTSTTADEAILIESEDGGAAAREWKRLHVEAEAEMRRRLRES